MKIPSIEKNCAGSRHGQATMLRIDPPAGHRLHSVYDTDDMSQAGGKEDQRAG
ncbi:MAG: hypothetical protein GXP27_10945 [Planctomycetes bacterium]|nr:hypothetical protein [Planctomycetota bacterium]